jgi:hypothetical protein
LITFCNCSEPSKFDEDMRCMLAFLSICFIKFIWRIRQIEETRSVFEIGSEQLQLFIIQTTSISAPKLMYLINFVCVGIGRCLVTVQILIEETRSVFEIGSEQLPTFYYITMISNWQCKKTIIIEFLELLSEESLARCTHLCLDST